jgi:hypothetical protein
MQTLNLTRIIQNQAGKVAWGYPLAGTTVTTFYTELIDTENSGFGTQLPTNLGGNALYNLLQPGLVAIENILVNDPFCLGDRSAIRDR